MKKRHKIKAMAARCQRARRGISLSSEKKENYESNIEMKRIQTKPAMTETYCNSKRGGVGGRYK